MTRNVNGTHTLPAGNPVVTGTTIEADWANDTMSDVSTEVTDSLSRSGKGGMLAPLLMVDGAAATPSIAFTNAPTTGWYRAGAGDMRFAVLGVDVMRITAGVVSVWTSGAWKDLNQLAAGVVYDPATSGLTAVSVQAALDEVQGNIVGGGAFELEYEVITADPVAGLVASSAYAFNSTAAAFTVTLPASPVAGAEIPFRDYAGTFAAKNVTLDGNGENIFGESGNHVMSLNRLSGSLKYIDAIQGWTY